MSRAQEDDCRLARAVYLTLLTGTAYTVHIYRIEYCGWLGNTQTGASWVLSQQVPSQRRRLSGWSPSGNGCGWCANNPKPAPPPFFLPSSPSSALGDTLQRENLYLDDRPVSSRSNKMSAAACSRPRQCRPRLAKPCAAQGQPVSRADTETWRVRLMTADCKQQSTFVPPLGEQQPLDKV